MPPEGSTRARILPGYPSLDRGSRKAEAGYSNGTRLSTCLLLTNEPNVGTTPECSSTLCSTNCTNLAKYTSAYHQKREIQLGSRYHSKLNAVGARWPKWLEREFADRKVCRSNPTSASRLPLSRLEQPDSIPALVQPPGGMAVRHRKGTTAERFFFKHNAELKTRTPLPSISSHILQRLQPDAVRITLSHSWNASSTDSTQTFRNPFHTRVPGQELATSLLPPL
ncbi:hypothetical protein CSKR_109197 [Clonorchis sinensis]|uniref:Uncharacterized protein n=1 Tax=Clonorchis sinensis TaxID=79923 RepID=A0A3R7H4H5_CLOSI|nr:hypothetical protein CSKR_109197 [Clonorchis sinensis]